MAFVHAVLHLSLWVASLFSYLSLKGKIDAVGHDQSSDRAFVFLFDCAFWSIFVTVILAVFSLVSIGLGGACAPKTADLEDHWAGGALYLFASSGVLTAVAGMGFAFLGLCGIGITLLAVLIARNGHVPAQMQLGSLVDVMTKMSAAQAMAQQGNQASMGLPFNVSTSSAAPSNVSGIANPFAMHPDSGNHEKELEECAALASVVFIIVSIAARILVRNFKTHPLFRKEPCAQGLAW